MSAMLPAFETDHRNGLHNGAPAESCALCRAEAREDRLFVNAERTVLVRLWASGTVEVARRDDPSHTWGPPAYLEEERC